MIHTLLLGIGEGLSTRFVNTLASHDVQMKNLETEIVVMAQVAQPGLAGKLECSIAEERLTAAATRRLRCILLLLSLVACQLPFYLRHVSYTRPPRFSSPNAVHPHRLWPMRHRQKYRTSAPETSVLRVRRAGYHGCGEQAMEGCL